MILKDSLKKILDSQKNIILNNKNTIKRDFNIKDSSKFAIIITGIRRCGKSTFLMQKINELDSYNYLNFEDSRLVDFELFDFEKLEELFKEKNKNNSIYFFDEIQNVNKWEIFIREKINEGKKIFLTGSNSRLLSKELGTRLTGRYLNYELFPFSFNEFSKFFKKEKNKTLFLDYLEKGGFPEYLKTNNPQILTTLFEDILIRDIIVRYKIRDEKILKQLAIYLISNIGKVISFNSLKKIFEVGSTNTILSYISFMENTYLFFLVNKFDFSYKKQLIAPKKIYCVDNALVKNIGLSFNEDKGRLLENLIFLFLRRNYKEIYYYKGNKECDFLIGEKNKITKVIQVCYELNNDNLEREYTGLLEAMTLLKLKEGLIITLEQEDLIIKENKKIKIIPAWKFLN
ncbi:MAG: ATP-binding protein [Candidatus Woesearchaeota archaeon]